MVGAVGIEPTTSPVYRSGWIGRNGNQTLRQDGNHTRLVEPSVLPRATWRGLGKPLESYCHSMGDFRRVGGRNQLKLQTCSTPPLGTMP